jgi:hypothetical protein
MTCTPCQITVKPSKGGFAPKYSGCLSIENGVVVEFKTAGIAVRPERVGLNVAACDIPPMPTSTEVPQCFTVEPPIRAIPDTDIVTVLFSAELDPACNWETGVTITVDGSPVNILGVTATGGTDPWGYEYQVDVTLAFNEVIVWGYDTAVGEICSLSGTLLCETTETTTVVCDLDFGTSTKVSWQAGTGNPIINGAIYTANGAADAAVNDPVASTINTIGSSSVEVYAEFEILDVGTSLPQFQWFGFGWKNSGSLSIAWVPEMIGIYRDELATPVWGVSKSLLGQSFDSFDVQIGPASSCVNVGVAIDALNNKVYVQMQGQWMTGTSGTKGGHPSGGLGWDILSPTAASAILYSYATTDNFSGQAVTPKYTPAGYTPVT